MIGAPAIEQPRSGRDAVAERDADRQRDVVAASGVARRRRAADSSRRMFAVARMSMPLDGLGPRDVPVVQGRRVVHVGVRLDEPGQQRDVAQVVDLVRVAGRRRMVSSERGTTPRIAAVLDEHGVARAANR